MNKSELCLCGSTFYYILLTIKNEKRERDCLYNLIWIINSSCLNGKGSDNLGPYSSKLKSCSLQANSTKYISFGKPAVYKAFKQKYENNYAEVVSDINRFFENYMLDKEGARNYFVKTVLALLSNDSHADNHTFWLHNVDKSLSKNDFINYCNNNSVQFYDFFASILYYVYCNFTIEENNRFGKQTVDLWADSKDITTTIPHYDEFSSVVVIVNNDCLPKNDSSLNDLYDRVNKSNDQTLPFSEIEAIRYLDKVINDYKNFVPFRAQQEVDFDSIHVCNNLVPKVNHYMVLNNNEDMDGDNYSRELIEESDVIHDITFNTLPSSAMTIIGSGGLGKSMLMRRLLLSCAREKDLRNLPVFITLGSIKNEEDCNLISLIQKEMEISSPSIDKKIVEELLDNSMLVLFLDGFDEIPQDLRCKFEAELKHLRRRYPYNTYILSSRKNPYITQLGLDNYYISSLTQDQAIEMIKRIPYADIKLKEDIIEAIRSNKFNLSEKEEKTFLGNPLFLSIIVTTYAKTHAIRTKRYLFYKDAYRVMYQEHDASKLISREYDTDLDIDELELAIGEFSVVAFAKNINKFEETQYTNFIHEVIDNNQEYSFSASDFESDIIDKLCLMYKDGDTYHWVHNSFQEYFTANLFARRLHKASKVILDLFIKYDTSLKDNETLSMLYGIDKINTITYIIIPYIEQVILQGKDVRKNPADYMDVYKDFLVNFHPQFGFGTFDLSDQEYDFIPPHAVYDFIANQYDLIQPVTENDFSSIDLEDSDLATSYYVRATDEIGKYGRPLYEYATLENLSKDEIYYLQHEDEFDDDTALDVEYSGEEFIISIPYIFQYKEEYKDFYDCMMEESFTLRQIFESLLDLLDELKDQISDNSLNNSSSILSSFH